MVSYRFFQEYIRSDYHVLPFSGAFGDQPQWIMDDFDVLWDLFTFNLIQEKEYDDED